MIYVYRVRRLVKIVRDETSGSTDIFDRSDRPRLQHCLNVFQGLSSRYKSNIALQTLAIATGQGYLVLGKGRHQTVSAKDKGLILLTPTGYINALCDSVSKVTPVIAIVISLAALSIAIWARLDK